MKKYTVTKLNETTYGVFKDVGGGKAKLVEECTSKKKADESAARRNELVKKLGGA